MPRSRFGASGHTGRIGVGANGYQLTASLAWIFRNLIVCLDDLKGSLGKVILMILIVSLFEQPMGIEYSSALDLLFLGVGIILVAGALFLTHALHKGEEH
jgi:uncharacterized membrane protein YqhA